MVRLAVTPLIRSSAASSLICGSLTRFVASENHELSFYREGDLINIRGRVHGVSYALNVSPRLAPADIVKAISRKSAA